MENRINMFKSKYSNACSSWRSRKKGILAIAFLFILVSSGFMAFVHAAPSAIYSTQWGSYGIATGPLSNPSGVAQDPSSGWVFVADSGHDVIHQVFYSGSALTFNSNFGGVGTGNGQFNNPTGLACDWGGNLYIADTGNNRIQVFHYDAGSGHWFYSSQFNGIYNGLSLNHPTAIVVTTTGGAGNIYIADSGNNRIVELNHSGTYVTSFTGSDITPTPGLNNPMGVTVDLTTGSGNPQIYVADTGNNRIVKFNSAGVYQAQWGSLGTGNSNFHSPTSISFAYGNTNLYIADQGNNRIIVTSLTGTYVTQWGTPTGSGNGYLASPSAVWIGSYGGLIGGSQNWVFVADTGNNRVQAFSTSGTYSAQYPTSTGNGQFYQDTAVAVDGNGHVFVADELNGRIQEFSTAGTYIRQWGYTGTGGQGLFYNPQGIAVDGSGNVWVADTANCLIEEFTNTGTFTLQFGGSGSGNGKFTGPNGVAVSPANGDVYVADGGSNSLIQVFSSTGTFLFQWGGLGSGNGQFITPHAIAFDGSGDVFVADEGNNRIQEFTSTGVFIRSWDGTSSGTKFVEPYGVAVDGNGNVYVADQFNDRVVVFDNNGNYVMQFGASGIPSGTSQLTFPNGVAVDGSGNVYIADTNNDRVVVYSTSGLPIPTGYLAVQGSNNAIYYRSFNTNGVWSDWSNLPNGATVDSPASTVCGNEVDFVVRGSDGTSLWHCYLNLTDGTFSSWEWISGSTPSAPTLVSNGTAETLVVRGSDNGIYYRVYIPQTRTWDAWQMFSGGSTSDQVAAVMQGNMLSVVVRGLGDTSTMWQASANLDTNVVSSWTLVPGLTSSSPTLTPWLSGNAYVLVVRGTDNGLYFNKYIGSGWQGWSVLPQGSTSQGPAATVIGNNLYTVVVGSDGVTLWQSSINLNTNSFSGWTWISGSTHSKPTLTS